MLQLNIIKYFSQNDDFAQITSSPGAYEFDSSDNEIKRNIIEESNFTEAT